MPMPSGRMVGSLYKNPFDCLWKTIATEGPLALYKGTYTSWGIDSPFFFTESFCRFDRPLSTTGATYVSYSVNIMDDT